MRLLIGAVMLTGCGGGLGSIEGFDLGHPQTAVWATDLAGDRVMVVASDLEGDLCDALRYDETDDANWMLWVWSTEVATYEAELFADAFAELRDGLIDEDFEGRGSVWVDDGDRLHVHVDLDFGADRVQGGTRADPCGVDLFSWLAPL